MSNKNKPSVIGTKPVKDLPMTEIGAEMDALATLIPELTTDLGAARLRMTQLLDVQRSRYSQYTTLTGKLSSVPAAPRGQVSERGEILMDFVLKVWDIKPEPMSIADVAGLVPKTGWKGSHSTTHIGQNLRKLAKAQKVIRMTSKGAVIDYKDTASHASKWLRANIDPPGQS